MSEKCATCGHDYWSSDPGVGAPALYCVDCPAGIVNWHEFVPPPPTAAEVLEGK